MHEIKYDQSNSQATLVLKESITIREASEIKDAMLDIFNSAQYLVIDQSQVETLDISYLQLLLSLKKSVHLNSKILMLNGAASESFTALLKDCGCPDYKWLNEESENHLERKHNE